jgi:hypothetical protein
MLAMTHDFPPSRDRRALRTVSSEACYFILPDFVFRFFAIKDEDGSVRAVQPFFMIDQDLLLGTYTRLGGVIGFIRRLWPRFMKQPSRCQNGVRCGPRHRGAWGKSMRARNLASERLMGLSS